MPQPESRPSIIPEMTGRSSVLSQEQLADGPPVTTDSRPEPTKPKAVAPQKKRLVIRKDQIKYDENNRGGISTMKHANQERLLEPEQAYDQLDDGISRTSMRPKL